MDPSSPCKAALQAESRRLALGSARRSLSRLVPAAGLAALALALIAPGLVDAAVIVLLASCAGIAAWTLSRRPPAGRAAASLDARAGGDDTFLAVVELPPGSAAAQAARSAAEARLRSGGVARPGPLPTLRPCLVGLAALATAWLVAREGLPAGGAGPGVPVAANPAVQPGPAEAEVAEEPGPGNEPREAEATPVSDAELEAALLALQERREQAERALAESAALAEVAEALSDALLQWDSPEAEAAAQAAARQDWEEVREQLEDWAEKLRRDPEGEGSRPRSGAEDAAAESSEALARAMRQAGDEAGAEAASRLSQASRGEGEAADAARSLAEAAGRAEGMQQAAQQAGQELASAEEERNALASEPGPGQPGEGPPATDPGQSAGTDPGQQQGEAAAALAEASLASSAVSGRAGDERRDQRTVAGDRADERGTTAAGPAAEADQQGSVDRFDLDAVPSRHREAVRRYFGAATPRGGER